MSRAAKGHRSMSLERCLPDMLATGEITQEQHDKMLGLFDEERASRAGTMGPDAAAAEASEAALQRFHAAAAQANRQAMLQVSAQARILKHADSFKGPNRGEDFIAVITHSDKAPYQNADALRHVIELQAHGMMSGILEKHSRNLAGR